jgi:hypothetical protein
MIIFVPVHLRRDERSGELLDVFYFVNARSLISNTELR